MQAVTNALIQGLTAALSVLKVITYTQMELERLTANVCQRAPLL